MTYTITPVKDGDNTLYRVTVFDSDGYIVTGLGCSGYFSTMIEANNFAIWFTASESEG